MASRRNGSKNSHLHFLAPNAHNTSAGPKFSRYFAEITAPHHQHCSAAVAKNSSATHDGFQFNFAPGTEIKLSPPVWRCETAENPIINPKHISLVNIFRRERRSGTIRRRTLKEFGASLRMCRIKLYTERNPRMHARKHPPVWETEINVVDEERNDSKHKFQLQLQHTQVQKTNLNDMVAICTLYSRVHVNYFPSFGTFFTPFRSPQRKPATPGVTRKWKCLNKKLHFKYRKMSTIVSRGARQSRPNMIFESIKCLLHCRHILSYIKQLSP